MRNHRAYIYNADPNSSTLYFVSYSTETVESALLTTCVAMASLFCEGINSSNASQTDPSAKALLFHLVKRSGECRQIANNNVWLELPRVEHCFGVALHPCCL
jgi:hypothetical protein